MTVSINGDALKTIEEIVNRGNKAVIQRTGSDIIVMEEKRKIKYSNTTPIRVK